MRNKLAIIALPLFLLCSLQARSELSFGLTYLVPDQKAQIIDNQADHRVWHNIRDTFNNLVKRISNTLHDLAR